MSSPETELKCPYCSGELHPPIEENGWGDEDGHAPLNKHVCKEEKCGKRFYTPA